MIYNKEAKSQLLGLYYLIFWKNYLKKEYLRDFYNNTISLDYNLYLKKLITIFLPLNSTSLIVKSIILLIEAKLISIK